MKTRAQRDLIGMIHDERFPGEEMAVSSFKMDRLLDKLLEAYAAKLKASRSAIIRAALKWAFMELGKGES